MAGRHDYTRYTQSEDDPFTARVMGFRNDDPTPFDGSYENWPADMIKEAEEGRLRTDQAQQDRIATGQNGTDFVALHPEYVDSDANGQLMNHQLKTMFGDGLHTPEQFEAAYQALRDSNFLTLNKVELEKQRKVAAKQRAEAERTKSVEPSVDELYSMDLHELRMRANGVWNK